MWPFVASSKAFYLNLAHRADRNAQLLALLAAHPWLSPPLLERVDAVDGRDLVVREMPEHLVGMQGKRLAAHQVAAGIPTLRLESNEFSPHLTPGAVGCALSHKLAWERFLASDAERALVLEDDLTLVAPELGARIQHVCAQLPDPYDLCYLGYHGGFPRSYMERHGPETVPAESEELLPASGAITGLYMYLLSRRGARRLLDSVFPLDVQVDVAVAIQLEHLSAWKLPKHDTLSLSLPSQFGDSDIQVLS